MLASGAGGKGWGQGSVGRVGVGAGVRLAGGGAQARRDGVHRVAVRLEHGERLGLGRARVRVRARARVRVKVRVRVRVSPPAAWARARLP